MPDLFEQTAIGSMVLANRFVRSATNEGLADAEGRATPELTAVLAGLARGGVGLIVSGHAFVSPEGRAGPRQLAADSDDCLPGLARLADEVHAAGGKIALQLAHAGLFAKPARKDLLPVGPSAPDFDSDLNAAPLDVSGIARVVDAFAAAARRARAVGFDAVQIHCAHTYLLGQFISPFFNKRTDGYGGGTENRSRLPVEVVRAVREAVGGGYPVLAKLNCDDFLPGGLTPGEALAVACRLEASGLEAVELSGGSVAKAATFASARPRNLHDPEKEAYYREAARDFKRTLKIPVMLVGGMRRLETCRELVRDGVADYVAICRPLICEPGLIARWRDGGGAMAKCTSDNLCYGPIRSGKGMYCVTFAGARSANS